MELRNNCTLEPVYDKMTADAQAHSKQNIKMLQNNNKQFKNYSAY